ncbi:ion transporter [Streptomyces sp. 891-h]|uniref:ion transporter n=1 Tax=Streptomyces sp. 891-h TaxID=2720714 RepID=UPI001FA952C4|nr:ion transporter [Streptomyces sp. 891-h]UNZ18114.1 ion transporter [Streptomyces sp. 891-h]
MASPSAVRCSWRARCAARCREITEDRRFSVVVFGMIAANAAVLGAETYAGVVQHWEGALRAVEHIFLGLFTVEILLRAGAHADRPKDFLRDPWNLFDFAVVLCGYLPVVRENATILRLLRLSRVLRAARFLPQLRIVLVAVGRSLPGTVSFLLVGTLLLYLYAMLGWVFFADEDPEHFGSLGRAVLTLFLLMTLDGLGDAVRGGLEVSRWALGYYASFVLLGSFVLVNVLVGVVIKSLDEASEMEGGEGEASSSVSPTGGHHVDVSQADEVATGEVVRLRAEIAEMRRSLDSLESGLARLSSAGDSQERV